MNVSSVWKAPFSQLRKYIVGDTFIERISGTPYIISSVTNGQNSDFEVYDIGGSINRIFTYGRVKACA